MALRVWLPLDGNLNNKGIASEIIATTTPVYVNNGKIGKAMSTGQAKMSAEMTASILNNQEFSFCCWIYVNAATGDTSNRAMLFGNGGMTAPNNRKFSIFQYPSCNDLHLSWQNDVTNATFTGGVWSGVFPSYQWTHLAITYKNPNGKIYINGNHYATFSGTSNSASFEYETILFSNIPNAARYLNDYRIYDHCLSAAEVREISQGLVLHYKLDGFQGGFGNPNLVTGSNTNSTSTNRWFGHSAVGGNTSTIVTDENGHQCVQVARDSTTQSSWDYLSYDNLIRNQIKTNTTYTVSFDCKPSVDGSIGFTGFLNGNATNYMTSSTSTIQGTCYANQWNHMVYRCTTKASFSDISVSGQVVYFSRSGSLRGVNTTVLFKNIKVEEGTVDTPWCPADSELAIDRTHIQDSSGYGHNGTINGILTLNSNTARYSAATYFNGTDAAIQIPFNDCIKTDDYTVSVWTYKSVIGEKAYQTILGGPSGFELEARSNTNTSPLYRIHNWGGGTTAYDLNKWNLFTFVRTASDSKLYVNGELKLTGTAGNAPPSGNYFIGAWKTATQQNYDGYMSDFRIYATALSADDIKQLYQVSAKVDNNQGWHTFEYIDENSKETITKTGKTMGHNIIETYIPLYDKTIYTEPDGSKWIHIFHHNNPANSKFDSPTTDWLLGKYMDANRWYDVDQAIYNSLSPYEFMVKQKTTSSAAETKYRWRQTANPLTATWTDVKPGTPTFITTTGYTSSSMGGMYLMKSSSLHMCIANGSNGNWFGGIGAAGAYNGGIPGYPNTTVTDGYIDLYIRVYANAKIIKTIGINAANLIEF